MNITDLTPELREELEAAAERDFHFTVATDFDVENERNFKSTFKRGALSEVAAKVHGARFIDIKNSRPPFNKRLLFLAKINWKQKPTTLIFDDELTTETESLEYGQRAYLLKDNSDYLVYEGEDVEELCGEYVIGWMPLPSTEL